MTVTNPHTPQRDIHIIEGQDYVQAYKIKTADGVYLNFTDYDAIGHIRENFAHTSDLIASFSFKFHEEEFEVRLPRHETYDISLGYNPTTKPIHIGFYDIFLITPTGERRYFVGGKVMYAQTITREL